MKKQLILCFILIASLASPLYSSAYSPKTINIHSPLYEETDILYRLHGLALPSAARPWSNKEAALILSAIPDEGKTANLKALALSRLESTLLKQGSNGLSYRFSTTIALEAYAHANTDQFVLPQDWSYNMDRRLPLFDFRIELQWHNSFYFSSSVEVGPSVEHDYNTTESTSEVGAIIPPSTSVDKLTSAHLFQKTFNTNLMTFNKQFQANWPRDSQITFGGDWWNLSLGRGPISWGVGQSGSLIIGNHIDSHNNLNINFFSEEFKLQLLYLFLPNPIGDDKEQRVFMGHRLEIQPLKWLRFAVTENVMFKGASMPFNYIDPTYIYHNHYDESTLNALASLEMHISLAPSFSVYSEFALDQFQLPGEGGSEANALGLLIGVTHSSLLKQGILTTNLEFVATDPSLYRRHKIDFLLVRGLHNNSNPMTFDYLGYKWGSDSIVLSAEMVYLIPGVARYALHGLIHRQGGVSIFGPHNESEDYLKNSDIPGPPPSGDTFQDQIIIGAEGSWWIRNMPMRIFTELSWIGRREFDNTTKTTINKRGDIQLVAGMVYSF